MGTFAQSLSDNLKKTKLDTELGDSDLGPHGAALLCTMYLVHCGMLHNLQRITGTAVGCNACVHPNLLCGKQTGLVKQLAEMRLPNPGGFSQEIGLIFSTGIFHRTSNQRTFGPASLGLFLPTDLAVFKVEADLLQV
jgi:hypothetical protein